MISRARLFSRDFAADDFRDFADALPIDFRGADFAAHSSTTAAHTSPITFLL